MTTPESTSRRRTTWPAAVPLQQAADTLRQVAPDITGPLAGLADPVADWLDETANALAWLAPFREHEPGYGMWETALRVANTINGEDGAAPQPDRPDRCPSCLCEDCGHSLSQHTASGCGGEDCHDPEYACSLAGFKPPERINHLAQQLGPLLSTHLGERQQRRCLAVAHAAHHAMHDYDYPNGGPR